MPSFARKILWIVGMTNQAVENRLRAHALAIGADGVCIRTTNASLPGAIGRFHAAGLKVYGWRWPAVVPTSGPNHYNAVKEAQYVAAHLIPGGLDGYIADPESDAGSANNDWNRPGLAQLAHDYCHIIRQAAGPQFAFGVTSGCIYPTNRPNIPWAEFVAASHALFPQTYWRARLGPAGAPTDINGGTPAEAIARGIQSWAAIAHGKPVIPMAGEIDVCTPQELTAYGNRVKQLGINQFHFYADLANVSQNRLAAMAAI